MSKKQKRLEVLPVLCKKYKCNITKNNPNQGKIKCKQKKNFKVLPVTEKPPQTQKTRFIPQKGITVNNLVITTEAQNLICAQTNT
jgi:hypothetical protein